MNASKLTIVLAAALSIQGCATCKRHPAVCATAVAVGMGSATLIISHRSGSADQQILRYKPPICGPRGLDCIN